MVKISLLMRLTLGYIAILVLVIALGVYVAINLNQINLLIRGTAEDGATLAHMEHLMEAIFSQVSFERKYLISQDPDFRKKFQDIQDLIVRDLKDGEPRMNTTGKKNLFSDVSIVERIILYQSIQARFLLIFLFNCNNTNTFVYSQCLNLSIFYSESYRK